MHLWKLLPPGWFAEDWAAGEPGDWDYGDGGGGDGGGGDDDDGDGGRDYEADRERERDEERERDRERDRERERERQRQEEEEQRRREEEERQRRLEEQRRQIEEQRRRMEEEEAERRRQEAEARAAEDADGDGIPDSGVLTPGASADPGLEGRLEEQFQGYEEQRQAQAQIFDPQNPGWIFQSDQTIRERTPSQATTDRRDLNPIDRETIPQNPREPGREYAPRTSDIATMGPAYKPPAFFRAPESEPEPEPERPLRTPEPSRVPEIAATAAAQAAAASGGTPEQIAQTAEHAARIASDRQTLAGQSAWTRAAFRSTYGDQAEAEWIRQHEDELARNQRLYGATEPRAGASPLGSAPVGTPLAPDRRIGSTPPPTAGQEARYGINGPAPARPAAAPATAAAPGQPGLAPLPIFVNPPPAARAPALGADTPAAQGPAVRAPSNLPRAGERPPEDVGLGQGSYPGGVPIGAPSALPPGAPTAGEPGGPPLGNYLPIWEPPSSRTNPVVRGELPVESGDPGKEARDWVDRGINPITGEPIQRENPYAQRTNPITGGPMWNDPTADPLPDAGYSYPSGESRGSNGVQQARDIVDYQPPEGARFTPTRNIVDYDPVTGETRERGYGRENLASTDTAVPAGLGTGGAPFQDPVLAAVSTSRPLAALADLAATARGPDYDPRQDAVHIANGIAAMLRGDRGPDGKYVTWAEPYLNDVARMAWAREERQNGRSSDPRSAPVEYIEKWKDAFYGSDHNVPLVKEIDQEMIDFAAARTPPGKPFRWQDVYGPTGEKGLMQAQVTGVDCGPTAFGAVLRSRGYNADAYDMFDYAIQNGYHSARKLGNRQYTNAPFNGSGAMVQMARDAGLNAREVALDDAGWAAVDKELAEGRPVMLSSAAHWYAISAKDDKGRYYAGPTGLGMTADNWLRRGEFRYGGVQPNTAVFTSGEVDPNSKIVKQFDMKSPVTGPGNTRPLLSGQTEYQTPGQRATVRMSNEMARTTPVDGGSAAASGAPPSDRANLSPRFTEADTLAMRERIRTEMPKFNLPPPGQGSVDDRMRAIKPAMDWYEKEYGYPGEMIAGLMYAENGVGSADSAAVRGNNLFSLQYNPQYDTLATGYAPGQSRWAGYRSVEDAFARKMGIFAHPENTNYAQLWRNRQQGSDAVIDGLIKGGYIIDEPGFPISVWRNNINEGIRRYRAANGR